MLLSKTVNSLLPSRCFQCCTTKKHRPGKPPGFLQQVADPSKPWEEIAVDFILELPDSKGSRVIWTVVDLFSKQAHFIACSGLPSARHLAKLFLKHIYRLHGVPERIISDRGVQFTAKLWREFICAIGSSSSAGLLGCIFISKCYIILLRPDTKEQQKCRDVRQNNFKSQCVPRGQT